MNRQSIHQQIESLLKIIQEQHIQIKQHQQSIPQVEIDFMIQNLRQLYEASLLLNHTNALSSLDEVKAAMAQKILAEKRSIELKHSEIKAEPKKEIVEEPVVQVIETREVETETIVTVVEATVEVPASSEKTKEKSKPRKSDLNSTLYEDKPTVGDKFGNGGSLHLKIASQSVSKTVADKLHHKPIKDLRAAIGINEKFLFINRLFEGNLQTYSEAIEKINSLNDFESAKHFTSELAVRLNWESENEHIKTFMELVERRFI